MNLQVNTNSPSTDTAIPQLPVLTAGDIIEINLQFLDKGQPITFTDPDIKFVLYQTGTGKRNSVASITEWESGENGVLTGLLNLRTVEIAALLKTASAVSLVLGIRVTSGRETRTYVTAPLTVRSSVEELEDYVPTIIPTYATRDEIEEMVDTLLSAEMPNMIGASASATMAQLNQPLTDLQTGLTQVTASSVNHAERITTLEDEVGTAILSVLELNPKVATLEGQAQTFATKSELSTISSQLPNFATKSELSTLSEVMVTQDNAQGVVSSIAANLIFALSS